MRSMPRRMGSPSTDTWSPSIRRRGGTSAGALVAEASDTGCTPSSVARPGYFPYGGRGNRRPLRCRRPRRPPGGIPVRAGRRYGTGMPDPWNYAGPVTQLGAGTGAVTLVDESTFAISGGAGDISPGGGPGAVLPGHPDRVPLRGAGERGRRPSRLAAVTDDPFSATFVSRNLPAPGRADSTLMVFRSRHVGQGMREELDLRNFSDEATACTVEVLVDADFADLFAVKEGRVAAGRRRGAVTSAVADRPSGGPGARRRRRPPTATAVQRVTYTYRAGRWPGASSCARRGRATVAPGLVTYEVVVPARGEWTTCIEVGPVIDGAVVRPQVPVRTARRAGHAHRAPGRVAPSGPEGRDRPPGAQGGRGPKRRGPRRPADLRSGLPRTRGGGGGSTVVHDGVRPGLAADGVDGAPGRPRPGQRRAADARPVPGHRGRSPPRGGARPHPPRDALR